MRWGLNPKTKKAICYIIDRQHRPVLYRSFRIWQQCPYQVAPLSTDYHQCHSCGTAFQGNYCPRCGQSANVGRFSFTKAFLLFLDVWGIGNRSMFRSIRDLMLRPGFMIRDYLNGMQSAYFPPFKMFFILATFSLLVEHGFSLDLDKKKDIPQKQETELPTVSTGDNINDMQLSSPMYKSAIKFAKMMNALREKNPSVFALLSLLLFSAPLFFFLRTSPYIPDLRFSEFIVALVYTSNTYSIYSIIGNLTGSSLFDFIAVLMIFVALRQFSGFKKGRLLWYLMLTIIISFVSIAALAGGIISVFYFTT